MARDLTNGLAEAALKTLKAVLAPRRLAAPVMAPSSGVVAGEVSNQGGAHFTDRGGLVLSEVHLWLIFWGSAWTGNGSPSMSDVADAAGRIFDSPYLSGLAQYRGIQGGRLKGTIQVSDTEPPNPFQTANVASLIHGLLDKGKLPEPDDDPLALYCVALPPGVQCTNANVIGEHSYFTYFDLTDLSLPPDFDIARVHYAWVSNDGTLDGITTVLSHELVESCTDPNGDGIQGVDGTCTQSGWCEIGDVCAGSDVRNGVRVQAYWSEAAGSCVVPGDADPPPASTDTATADVGRGTAKTAPARADLQVGQATMATQAAPSTTRRWRPLRGASYTGGLLATLWLAAIVAAIITIGTFITPTLLPPWARLLSDSPALAGPLIAVLLWLLMGALYSPAASARNANTESYADLQARLTQLTARLEGVRANLANTSAFHEAAGHGSAIAAELDSSGPRWITATGYVATWKRLHRAEEALLELEPRNAVLGEIAYDEFRLHSSNMQGSGDLMTDLGRARSYLQAIGQPSSNAPLTASPPSGSTATSSIASEADARVVVRNVRFMINDFRDKRWAALVSARNLLYGTMIMTELFAFAVLGLAVIDHAPAGAIIAGVVFFLVGALVGLFNRLNQQATAGTEVEDYALAWVRLILTPVLSGLAAIGGVVLTGMLTLSGLTGLVQPGSNGAASTVTLPVLADIFDLNKFRIGFLLALIFGGTPLLIGNRLQQLTDQYKNDLKSTEATTGTVTSKAATQ